MFKFTLKNIFIFFLSSSILFSFISIENNFLNHDYLKITSNGITNDFISKKTRYQIPKFDSFNKTTSSTQLYDCKNRPFRISIPDIEVPIYYQKSFTSNYFKNLKTNYIKNEIGSCGYTALSQYLSFLDTYWNGKIIADKYNQKTTISSFNDLNESFDSPGINDNFNYKNYDYEEFNNLNIRIYNFINDAIKLKESSFFGLLLNYGNSYKLSSFGNVGFYDYHFQRGDLYSIETNFSMLNYIIEQYIENNKVLAENSSLISKCVNESVTKEQLMFEIKALLRQGIPLILGVFTGHECVAYEYDEINDEIFINLGYDKSSNHLKLSEYLSQHLPVLNDPNSNYVANYKYIEIGQNIPHMHQLSYKIANNQIYNCACSLSSYILKYIYLNYNKFIHYKRSIKSLVASSEFHYVTFTYTQNGHEYGACRCGHVIDISKKPNLTF